ncbi:MAG TPA: serine/threonine-protein kinase, partial [Steroidobacteraceae bacterium]|nr:serine/threonine-protein kinase [Steroidobacteraceae bacterium]
MIEAAAASHGRTFSARYTLLEKLGAGGQAEVWRARDEVAGVEVALKILNPSLARDETAWTALVREHAIASRLEHPAILRVQPPYREGDFAALPMELATGGDLRRLRGANYLEIVPVLIDIAQALEYAHEQGVIHRDLKPGNVLFDSRGRVRLADFGVAGLPGEANPVIARPGLSPFTASPEQLRGDPPSVADDIYGLGALAYELLSGYPPYYPRFEVKRAMEEPVPELKPAKLMPPQLAAAIMRMLSKRPSLRPHSMRDVIDEFDAALNDTLTFDFDRLDEPGSPEVTPVTTAMRRDASVIAAAEAARRPAPSPPPPREPPVVNAAPAASMRLPEAAPSGPSAAMKQIDEELRVTGALAKHPEASRTLEVPSLEAAEARPAFAPPGADHAGGIEVGTFGSTVEEERIASAAAAVREAAPSLGSSRSPPTDWDDVRLRVDPRFRRAEPPRRRSWPWVVLIALAAAAVAVFVVLPRYAQNGGDISLPDVVKNAQAIVAKATADAKSAVSSSSSSGNTAVESSTQTAQTSVPSGGGVVSGLGAAQRVPDLSAPPSESASLPAGASTSAGTDSSGSGPAGDPLAKARDTFTQRLAALDAR